jgi:hypothetical protein
MVYYCSHAWSSVVAWRGMTLICSEKVYNDLTGKSKRREPPLPSRRFSGREYCTCRYVSLRSGTRDECGGELLVGRTPAAHGTTQGLVRTS